MSTPQLGIPTAPEGVLDPGAAMNLALEVIDALSSAGAVAVLNMNLTAPPGAPANGQQHIVAAGGTGAWAGWDLRLVRYVEEGAFWLSFVPGDRFRMVLDMAAGVLYRWTGSAYAAVSGGAVSLAPVVNVTDASLTATPENAGNYSRFSHAAPTYTFDGTEEYTLGAEYHGRYVGEGVLTIEADNGMVINAPADGGFSIPPGGTFTVKIVAVDESAVEADLFGVTSAGSP